MRRELIALVALVALVHAGAGCTLLSPSRAEMPRLHALGWEPPIAIPRPAPDAPTLLVGIPRAGPGFDSPRIAYVSEPHALAYFARHQWVDTPARMLQPLLARAAESTGRFAAVVQAPSSVAATLRLDVEVVRVVQDFSVRPSQVHVDLRVQLVDTEARRVVAGREISATERAPSDDPPGGVAGVNRAVGAALREVAELCESASRGQP